MIVRRRCCSFFVSPSPSSYLRTVSLSTSERQLSAASPWSFVRSPLSGTVASSQFKILRGIHDFHLRWPFQWMYHMICLSLSLRQGDWLWVADSRSASMIWFSCKVVPVFALLSALALSFIVYRCIRLVVIPSFRGNATMPRAPENLFFRTHLGHYAASLVFSNVVLTSAGLMEFFWVRHSGIYYGMFSMLETMCRCTDSHNRFSVQCPR